MKIPLNSRNPLANWFFRELVKILKYRIRAIRRKPNLKYPGISIEINGCLINNVIYLEHDQIENELVKTLIHELTHSLCEPEPEKFKVKRHKCEYMDDLKNDWPILVLEKLLWRTFSKEQKQFFRKCIPRSPSARRIRPPKKAR